MERAAAGLYGAFQAHVPERVAQLHVDDLRALAEPGTWWTGRERLGIAQRARDARRDAGLQEPSGAGDAALVDVSGATDELIRALAVEPKAIDRAFVDAPLAAGLSDAHYVELVGVVASLVNLDVFASGLDRPIVELPPAVDGEPSRERPSAAIDEGAWLPTIPWGGRGGELGRALYGKDVQPFIYRALSLVPAEAARAMALGDAQYLGGANFFDFEYSETPGLARPQVELVAGRTSVLNECFY